MTGSLRGYELLIEGGGERIERDRLAASRGPVDDAQLRPGIADRRLEILDEVHVGLGTAALRESLANGEGLRHATDVVGESQNATENGAGAACFLALNPVGGIEKLNWNANAAGLTQDARRFREKLLRVALPAGDQVAADGSRRLAHLGGKTLQQRRSQRQCV